LEQEIAVLEGLLPKTLDEEGLRAALGPQTDAIRGAANDGQATGLAMKALKAQGATVDGKLVGEVVRKIRATSGGILERPRAPALVSAEAREDRARVADRRSQRHGRRDRNRARLPQVRDIDADHVVLVRGEP